MRDIPRYLYKNCECLLHLPFSTEIPLNIDKLVNTGFNLRVRYELDLFRPHCAIVLDYGNDYIEYVESSLTYQVPVTSGGLSTILGNLGRTALTLATGYMYGLTDKTRVIGQGSMMVRRAGHTTPTGQVSIPGNKGFVNATYDITEKYKAFSGKTMIEKNPNMISRIGNDVLSISMNTQHSGYFGENVWIQKNVDIEPYLIIITPDVIDIPNYAHLIGRPSSYSGKLKELNGYTEVGAVHMDGFPNALSEELDEIESLLKSGVIL